MSIPPNRLFTVTLDALATYEINVAAPSAEEACHIARLAYIDTPPPEDFTRCKSDIATAAVPYHAAVRQFTVEAEYRIDFAIKVPAPDRESAVRHARRLFATDPSPWEYDTALDGVNWFSAREVES